MIFDGMLVVKVTGMDEKQDVIEDVERREVMSAILKYSAVVGGASTVVLSASDAVAKSAASGSPKKKPRKFKNRWGKPRKYWRKPKKRTRRSRFW